jgi:hypothetical protein
MVAGSLDQTPPAPSDMHKYFPLNLTDYDEAAYYGEFDDAGFLQTFSGIDAWSLKSNVLWIIFYWVATDNKGVPYPSHLGNPTITLTDSSVVPNKIDRIQLRS